MRIIRFFFIPLLLGVTLFSCGGRKESGQLAQRKQLLKNWKMISSTRVRVADSLVSVAGFRDEDWLSVTVPTTVLRALVKAGVYPDPHYDLNNFRIPDASDELNERLKLGKFSHLEGHPNPFRDPYWFRTTIEVPEGNRAKTVLLNFDGINYRADVWVNGRKVADAGDMVGMFTRFKYNITGYVNPEGSNVLAVRIHQVDHPGAAEPGVQLTVFGPHRGHGVDIFKDATLKMSAGWDCAPVVRDRNMGIYQDVYLTYTDAVDIIDPYIVTALPLPDTTSAALTVSASLHNESDAPVRGVLRGSVDFLNEIDFVTYKKRMPGDMETVFFEKEVTVPAGQTVTVTFDPENYPQLKIANPHLWWPNGYGAQYLHELTLRFDIDGKISDEEKTIFGVREINSTLKEIDGEYGRTFRVNGRRIFARGGWLQPDMMLDMNEKRIYNEARLLAHANVNMIANEDMPSPPDHVMEAYDKYGLLMWETFFQCWTSYPGTDLFKNPADAALAVRGGQDIVKRYRNHPSLVLWTMACETMIREEIYSPLRSYIKKMDSVRIFIPTSSIGWDVDALTPYLKPDLPLGMTDEGPPDYTWYPHAYYYSMVLRVKQQMFRNEMGVPSVPVLSSMKKFIFNLGEAEKGDIYPLDSRWAHHGAWDDNGYVYKAYDEALRKRYGAPSSAEDYIRKAQYVNAGSYRAMYEAWNHRMWDITQGVMLWKLNSTWPTVVWQLYDWFLNPTSAYYFAKKAMEPLHIQVNEHDMTVSVINRHHRAFGGLTASVALYDFDMKKRWGRDINFEIGADRYSELLKIPVPKGLTDVYFVKLELKDSAGKLLSDNFYWFSSKDPIDFTALAALEKTLPEMEVSITDDGPEKVAVVRLRNATGRLSFFNRLLVRKGEGGEEVLPTFWSDNFITLLPGEEKTVTARFATAELDGAVPVVDIDENH